MSKTIKKTPFSPFNMHRALLFLGGGIIDYSEYFSLVSLPMKEFIWSRVKNPGQSVMICSKTNSCMFLMIQKIGLSSIHLSLILKRLQPLSNA